MKIGDVASALDIPASTIRYYERAGLLGPQRRVAGRREFDEAAIRTLRFVRLAKSAGFTLDEIRQLRDQYDRSSVPAEVWQPLAHAKQAAIQEKIAELRAMDAVLGELLSCRCPTVADCVERAARRKSAG